MNLVAKEYVACRHDDRGVLVLSEFTGAALELIDALLVNPHDTDGVKAAVARALTMPEDEHAGGCRRCAARCWTTTWTGGRAPSSTRWVWRLNTRTRCGGGGARPGAGPARRARLRRRARADRAGSRRRRGRCPVRPRPSARWPTLPATTVAMLSGRALDDLRAVSGFGPPVRLVGSHGAEFDDGAAGARPMRSAQRRTRWSRPCRRSSTESRRRGSRASRPGSSCTCAARTPEVGERVLDAVRTGPARLPGVERPRARPCWTWRSPRVSKGSAIDTLRERWAPTPCSSRRRRHRRDGVRPAAARRRRHQGRRRGHRGGHRVATPEDCDGGAGASCWRRAGPLRRFGAIPCRSRPLPRTALRTIARLFRASPAPRTTLRPRAARRWCVPIRSSVGRVTRRGRRRSPR